MPNLGDLMSKLVWPDYTANWPTNGPYINEQFTPMGAIGIPLLNTIILVTSGFTLTVAHHALKLGHRGTLKVWLFLTIALGFTFLGFQGYEYFHAYHALNLKLSTGVYGSTFFMLTGFHGFHVTVGAIMLAVMLGRVLKGHFDASTTSRSRRRRGTGTSSTSCGYCCSSSSTGSELQAELVPRASRALAAGAT